ncbi:MAG: hypothetical protein AB7P78_18540 [Candidatus Binatia bacterium]
MNDPDFAKALSLALASCVLISCLHDSGRPDDGLVGENPPGPLRIYYDPYAQVDWTTDKALLAQHHDHAGASIPRLMAYDNAGYNVMPLMDYSGVPKMQSALRQRLWPISSCVTPETIARFQNIKLLFPNAEEVGIPQRHLTSPFMTDFIEHYDGAADTDPAPKYHTEEDAVDLIRSRDGLPLLAHPWYSATEVLAGPDVFGMEIYSAYIAAKRAEGVPDFVNEDRNAKLLSNWDAALSTGRWWVGIAVNDHYGPYAPADATEPALRDSGKILVYVHEETLESYRDAFERGALFAIQDKGVTKGGYPKVQSVAVGFNSVTIDAPDATAIHWIVNGDVIGTGPTLQYSILPPRSVYLRAEILGETHVVYTQPFILRHVEDMDGDGRLSREDEMICEDLARGLIASSPELVAACEEHP